MRQNPHVRICGGPGSATTLVYPTSMSSQVRSRISCLRQPAARRVRRRWWGRRFPTRAVRRGPDERRVGGRCQGRGPCEAWLGVHRRAVMPRTSFSTPRHVPSESLECHRSWPAMWVYPGFPTVFRGLSEFFVGDLMGKALWKLVENAQRFPRRGGRVLCVHGPVSFHRARPCATKWPPRRGLRTGPPASSDCGRP